MNVLFVTHVTSQSRHFTGLFAELIRRGHHVTLATEYRGKGAVPRPDYLKSLDNLRLIKGIQPTDFWGRTSKAFRGTRSYLLYYHPKFADHSVFRDRAYDWTDPFLRRWLPPTRPAADWVGRALQRIERAVPVNHGIVNQLRADRYDVMLISPLISYQNLFHYDYVKAANSIGLPVGFPVFSWDNLSTKGIMQIIPDRVWVWNDVQRWELEELHDAPAARISVLGAWRFDEFRALSPSQNRDEFCRSRGLDPAIPIVTYLGSSPAIAPTEAIAVGEWIEKLRASRDPLLANANLVIRAHPRNVATWKDRSRFNSLPRVHVQFPESINFWDMQGLYDLLAFSHACVGANTSAMLEAAILKRPVYSLLSQGFGLGLEEVLHFEYLTSAGGGLLYLASDYDEHFLLLGESIRRPLGEPDARASAFFDAFLAPPAGACSTVQLADEVESLSRIKKNPMRRGIEDRLLDPLLRLAVTAKLIRNSRYRDKG